MQGPDNKAVFAKYGLKNTKHRNLIYNILKDSDCPLTMEDIFLELKDVDTSISFSTVYRVLEAFAAKRIAEKSNSSTDGKSAFELNPTAHKHRLICIGCKKMVAIEGCPLGEFSKSLEKNTQFDITAHRLELFGYCPDCRDKQ